MSLLINGDPYSLWLTVIKEAEDKCSIHIASDLELYLTNLLIRYTNHPALVKKIISTTFLEAMQQEGPSQRLNSLQAVGDQCLLFTGLFPKLAVKRHVSMSYFVTIGQTAYMTIADKTHDLFRILAYQFVMLTDILQSIRIDNHLLPLEAFEQWQETGSQRAYHALKSYTKQGLPTSIPRKR